MEDKKFVRIQSSRTIRVTSGLEYADITSLQATNIPDRLKVSSFWPKTTVLISAGTGLYPAEIAKWNTVKSLQKDKILTIGEFVDDAEESVKEVKEVLDRNIQESKKKLEEIKKQKKSLNDLAGV